MSNGLEQEFPEVAWPAVAPIGPRGMSPEVARDYVAHGRELHGLAIRDGVRTGRGAVARALTRHDHDLPAPRPWSCQTAIGARLLGRLRARRLTALRP